MNIKGQFKKLTIEQKDILKWYAHCKKWQTYWRYKYKCLKLYEQTELERSVEGSVLV